MNTGRDAFLGRVRRAVREGNRAGQAPPLPERGHVGYQGAGDDPAARFVEQCTAAGGRVHRAPDHEGAAAVVLALVQEKAARRALVGPGDVVGALGLPVRLRGLGMEAVEVAALPEEGSRDVLFAADIGISGVNALIAETGTLVVRGRPGEPRSLSLLPPVHIAVAEVGQIVPDLFDLFGGVAELPSCLTLITGPSKTGDIELRLVTGVHGPGEVHVVLLGGEG